MLGGNNTLNHGGKERFLPIAAFIVFAISMFLANTYGILIVDNNISIQYAGIFIFPLVATVVLSIAENNELNIYLRSSLSLFYLLLTVLSYPYFNIMLLLAISFLFSLYGILYKKSGNSKPFLKKALAFSLSYLAMMIISGLFRLNIKPQTIGILLASISDDVHPGGTPIIFSNGIVLFSRYIVLTLSIQSIILFFILSVLLVENYFLIFSTIRTRSGRAATSPQLTGALSVLSCQCESITAAFPSIVSLILSVAIIPLILESIVLVGLTNYILRLKFQKGLNSPALSRIWPGTSRSFLLIAGSIMAIVVPITYIAGTFLKLEGNLFFYGMENFAMFLTGMILIILAATIREFRLGTSMSAKLALVFASSLLMFIWFYPVLSKIAVTSGLVFGIMGLISLAGGAIGGIAYVSSGQEGKSAYIEYLSMMFSMFAIVIFYVSILFSYRIWGVFTITQQVEFSIALWIIALPSMWLSTNLVLNLQVRRQNIEEKPARMVSLPVQ